MSQETKSDQDLGVDTSDIIDDISRKQWADVSRTMAMIGLGGGVLFGSTPLAELINEPAIAAFGLWIGYACMVCAASHVLRRLLFPYIDLKRIAAGAVKDPTGAGLVFLGVCFVLGCLIFSSGSAKAGEIIPQGAFKYGPVLIEESKTHWPDFKEKHFFFGQVEQESCITLKHSKCWTPFAELRTSRERGVGLGQITKTAKFDALGEMTTEHKEALKGWAWESDSLYDARFQLRALVLKNKGNYNRIVQTSNDREHIAMMLIAYNGGLGRVISDRKICQSTAGCDSSKWFGHAEKTSLLPKIALKGYGKSFFEINREYPHFIMDKRSEKYKELAGLS